ncbi:hypothetical protein MUG78_13755 [Gordonia alkaliphila]|uniref:hypothetical protein n=1 Tax=Gordonia alkaliphila TaxID=1053547 RepID=UPI001FF23F09|nr:hypothetical protein [Gordonia alkaliphila]MCK0440492.1 hypothetical protein [Gordonia alkaliphila]
MSATLSTGVALVFVWLGMVLAISFLEAPLKFQAPGITIPLGLGIGRLVFRALNAVESVLAVTLVVTAAVADDWSRSVIYGLIVAVGALALQVLAVRPALSRRTAAVLADPENVPAQRSRAHLAYVACELVKIGGLLTAGIALLL